MKEIKINLSEKNQEELNEKLKKLFSKQRKRNIAITILQVIFVIVLTMTFSKIGKKLEAEFLFGQLTMFLIFIVASGLTHYLQKLKHEEIQKTLFENKELADIINQKIEEIEEDKDGFK